VLLKEKQSLGIGTHPAEVEMAELGRLSARTMCWVVAPAEGVWGAAGSPGQAGPSHPLGLGAGRGERCGTLDLGSITQALARGCTCHGSLPWKTHLFP